jgi:hypothetical protein
MAQSVFIDQEMLGAVGYETQPVAFVVDRTMITRFIDAVADTNPRWGLTGGGDEIGRELVAPPSLLCTNLMLEPTAWIPIADKLPKRLLDGGGEWEFYAPIRLGDTLFVVNRLVDLKEQVSRLGPMLIVVGEATWRNQYDEVVARARTTILAY